MRFRWNMELGAYELIDSDGSHVFDGGEYRYSETLQADPLLDVPLTEVHQAVIDRNQGMEDWHDLCLDFSRSWRPSNRTNPRSAIDALLDPTLFAVSVEGRTPGEASFLFSAQVLTIESRQPIDEVANTIVDGSVFSILSAKQDTDSDDQKFSWIWIDLKPAVDATVRDLVNTCGRLAFVLALSSPELDLATVISALSMGFVSVLRGTHERAWLEAKQQGYDTESELGRYKLAVDIAAFANSPSGGLLVLGAKTVHDGDGRDVIVDVKGIRPGLINTQSYLAIIDDRVYPQVGGIGVIRQQVSDKEIIAFFIPNQSDHDRPFLVRGGLASSDKVDGNAVTLAVRKDSGNTFMTVREIHSALSRSARIN